MKATFNKLKQQAKNKTHKGMVWFQQRWVTVKQVAANGCTGVPDLGLTEYCDQHDADYTPGSGVSRFKADWQLMRRIFKHGNKQKLIAEKSFYWVLSLVFFIGVRIAGRSHYQKSKKK